MYDTSAEVPSIKPNLVVVLGDDYFSASFFCQTCLLATQEGLPRWRNGQLACGKRISEAPLIVTEFRCINGGTIVDIG
jgi:hypothetical protein